MGLSTKQYPGSTSKPPAKRTFSWSRKAPMLEDANETSRAAEGSWARATAKGKSRALDNGEDKIRLPKGVERKRKAGTAHDGSSEDDGRGKWRGKKSNEEEEEKDSDSEDDLQMPSIKGMIEDARRWAAVQKARQARELSLSTEPEEVFYPTVIIPYPVKLRDTCLAKVKTCYFHGKLVAFEPTTRKGGHDVYIIEMFDGEVRRYTVKRTTPRYQLESKGPVIFKHEVERLAKCEIGDYVLGKEITSSLIDDPNFDTNGDTGTNIGSIRTRVITPPLPFDSIDSLTSAQFAALSVNEQVIALRPQLLQLVQEQYPSAKWRLDLFFDRQFEELAGQSNLGTATDRETDIVVAELCRWLNTVTTGSSRFARIKSDRAQQKFAVDVLLPEFMIARCIKLYDLVDDDPVEVEQGGDVGDNGDAVGQSRVVNGDGPMATATTPDDSDGHDSDDYDNDQGLIRPQAEPKPSDAYSKAREELRRQVEWQDRIEQFNLARAAARKKYGLAPEDIQHRQRRAAAWGAGDKDVEMAAWKAEDLRKRGGGVQARKFGGRILKKVVYKE